MLREVPPRLRLLELKGVGAGLRAQKQAARSAAAMALPFVTLGIDLGTTSVKAALLEAAPEHPSGFVVLASCARAARADAAAESAAAGPQVRQRPGAAPPREPSAHPLLLPLLCLLSARLRPCCANAGPLGPLLAPMSPSLSGPQGAGSLCSPPSTLYSALCPLSLHPAPQARPVPSSPGFRLFPRTKSGLLSASQVHNHTCWGPSCILHQWTEKLG